MVAKNKGLYLGLLLSMLGIGNIIQAYKLTFKNETKYKVSLTVIYKNCNPNKKKLSPGKSVKINSKSCIVKQVLASVFVDSKRVYGKKMVLATPYFSSSDEVDDMAFVIEGPFRVRRGKIGSPYKITREK